MARNLLLTVGGVNIYGYSSDGYTDNNVLAFESGMNVDADGSPHAYHPLPGKGLDNLADAGKTGDWWALVTDNGASNGTPIVQGPDDPAPGYYVSTTSLCDGTKADKDPLRYVNAEVIPYVALPSVIRQYDFKLGDIGYAYYKSKKQHSYFIFADGGPAGQIGEGSIKLAENLGIDPSPISGGAPGGVVYILFTGSGDGNVKTAAEIENIGDYYNSRVNISSILDDF